MGRWFSARDRPDQTRFSLENGPEPSCSSLCISQMCQLRLCSCWRSPGGRGEQGGSRLLAHPSPKGASCLLEAPPPPPGSQSAARP